MSASSAFVGGVLFCALVNVTVYLLSGGCR